MNQLFLTFIRRDDGTPVALKEHSSSGDPGVLFEEFRREMETLQSKSWVSGIVRLYGAEFTEARDSAGRPQANYAIVLELMEANLKVDWLLTCRRLCKAGGPKNSVRPVTWPLCAMSLARSCARCVISATEA